MEPKELFMVEGNIINSFFKSNTIRAKVDWKSSIIVKTGYFRYGLLLDPRERFNAIESSQRELQTILAKNRGKLGIKTIIGRKEIPFTLIPSSFPTLALETPHPSPVPLLNSNATIFDGQPHTMSLGRSYTTGVNEEMGDLTASPHWLICGITSAGKSVLLQNMLTCLAARTPSEELKFFLIDLKNEDLVPFQRLPHTLEFAGTVEKAMRILKFVENEKNKRIEDPTYKPYRLVLAVDEMAHLAGIKEANQILGRLASIGRSKWINLIGATQHPTKEGGMGALLKANFTTRCVGQVAPGQSQYATNRPGTHAELLPGFGAFLRCEGPSVYRFQSYYLPSESVGPLVNTVVKFYSVPAKPTTQHRNNSVMVEEKVGYNSVMQPVTAGYNSVTNPVTTSYNDLATREAYAANANSNVVTKIFPLERGRPLTDVEAAELRRMVRNGELNYGGKPSETAMCHLVFGSKDPKRVAWIREALG